MQREITAIQNVRKYLINLGYPEVQIISNVRVDKKQDTDFSIYRKELDLVVYNENSAWLVVEVKSNIDFSVKDVTELRYNPYVRQLQSYARALNAPYYLLSNGDNYLWFTTDNSGRPQIVENPILPSDLKSEVSSNKLLLTKVLREFKNILLQNKFTIDIGYEASTIILAKLLSEHGDNFLEYSISNQNSYI